MYSDVFSLQYDTTGSRPDLTERSPAEEHSVGAWRGGLHWTRHKAHAGRSYLQSVRMIFFLKKAQSSGHTSNLKPYFLGSFTNVVLFYVLI